jgi:hypothetical protein
MNYYYNTLKKGKEKQYFPRTFYLESLPWETTGCVEVAHGSNIVVYLDENQMVSVHEQQKMK